MVISRNTRKTNATALPRPSPETLSIPSQEPKEHTHAFLLARVSELEAKLTATVVDSAKLASALTTVLTALRANDAALKALSELIAPRLPTSTSSRDPAAAMLAGETKVRPIEME